MFGPLPRLHRALLALTVLLLGIASGAWVAHATAMPVAVTAGAALGAVGGAVLAYALLHDFHSRARPVRATRRH